MQKHAQPGVSLLYPSDAVDRSAFQHWSKNALADLAVDKLVKALRHGPTYEHSVREILLTLCSDPEIITYRQETLEDFLNNPDFVGKLASLLPLMERLHTYAGNRGMAQEDSIQQLLGRLNELNTYLSVVQKMRAAFQSSATAIRSRALKELDARLGQLEADETFQSMQENLPEMLARLNGVPSITLGINLDNELRPVEAVLLSVNDKPFKGGSFLDRLVGRKKAAKGDQGIGPIHEVPSDFVQGIDSRVVRLPNRIDPLMVPLFRDVYEVLKAVISPIASGLRRYAQVHADLLLPLDQEIAFYLGAAALVQQMRELGLPMCRPEVLPAEARAAKIDQMYNLLLALHPVYEHGSDQRAPIVLNDVDFGPDGRIFILTGPNQGGKTVYTQAVGMLQLLFQAGLYVPARQASISPVDGIYTHFATEEEFNSRQGRLSEEASRLSEIFKTLTRHSLVLLNESLSSTSPRESFYLSLDIVRALRLYEVRAIFATHLHELADGLDSLNAEGQSDSLIASLVAGVEAEEASEAQDVARTYQIKPGPPRGLSYARGIAHRFGISYEQLAERKKIGQP
jgi:DNA mismatch repair ATPase MutS